MSIHPTAIVSETAELGTDVEVGPYSIIEDGVRVGDGCRIGSHVVLKTSVTIGSGCQLDVGVVLGSEPQDRKFQGEQSFVRIGDNNIIREYVTIHRATGEGEATLVGNGNFLMAYCHLGHNVQIGNDVMIAGYTGLSGDWGLRAHRAGRTPVHDGCWQPWHDSRLELSRPAPARRRPG